MEEHRDPEDPDPEPVAKEVFCFETEVEENVQIENLVQEIRNITHPSKFEKNNTHPDQN